MTESDARSELWTPPKRTDAEWDALPPLIKPGEDAAARLDEIVTAWCTPSLADGGAGAALRTAAGGLVLDGVDLVDASTTPPTVIDLGDLLRRVEDRLRQSGEPEEVRPRPDLHIALRGCRVRVCQAATARVRPRWTAAGCLFGKNVGFQAAAFASTARFDSSAFLGAADFQGVTFLHTARFDLVTFAGAAFFGGARFEQFASFDLTVFSSSTDFEAAAFGLFASFKSAVFEGTPSFRSVVFHGSADFASVAFANFTSFAGTEIGKRCSFAQAMFGDDAEFNSAAFGDSVTFRGTAFGKGASLRDVRVCREADFEAVRFGPGGGLGGVVVASQHPGRVLDAMSKVARVKALPDLIRRWFIVRSSWNAVRDAGESEIIGRASATALIIVPIVAGCWPAVRAMVHAYALGLGEARGAYEAARAALLLAATEHAGPGGAAAPPAGIEPIVRRLDEQVGAVTQQMSALTAAGVDLPVGWALGFFAALAITLARTVYGWGAPALIRAGDRDQTAAAAADKFRESKDQHRDLLVQAITRLQEAARELPEVRHPNLVRRHGAAVWVPSSLEQYDRFVAEWEEYKRERASAGDDADDLAKLRPPPTTTVEEMQIILVEEGATAEYDLKARVAPIRMHITALLYAVGFYLVAWLVVLQATAILKQTRGGRYWPDYWGEAGLVLIAVWAVMTAIIAGPWAARGLIGLIKEPRPGRHAD
jgi:hypothetical protein